MVGNFLTRWATTSFWRRTLFHENNNESFWQAGTSKMAVFWVVAPCTLVEVYQRFRGPCCLHHQGDGGSKVLWKFGTLLPDCTALQLRRQSSSYSRHENLKSYGTSRFIFWPVTLCELQSWRRTQYVPPKHCQKTDIDKRSMIHMRNVTTEVRHVWKKNSVKFCAIHYTRIIVTVHYVILNMHDVSGVGFTPVFRKLVVILTNSSLLFHFILI
jgi:hypothetical protein